MSSSHDIHIMIEDETSSSQDFSTIETSSGQSGTQKAIHTEESGMENFRTDSTSNTLDSENHFIPSSTYVVLTRRITV